MAKTESRTCKYWESKASGPRPLTTSAAVDSKLSIIRLATCKADRVGSARSSSIWECQVSYENARFQNQLHCWVFAYLPEKAWSLSGDSEWELILQLLRICSTTTLCISGGFNSSPESEMGLLVFEVEKEFVKGSALCRSDTELCGWVSSTTCSEDFRYQYWLHVFNWNMAWNWWTCNSNWNRTTKLQFFHTPLGRIERVAVQKPSYQHYLVIKTLHLLNTLVLYFIVFF